MKASLSLAEGAPGGTSREDVAGGTSGVKEGEGTSRNISLLHFPELQTLNLGGDIKTVAVDPFGEEEEEVTNEAEDKDKEEEGLEGGEKKEERMEGGEKKEERGEGGSGRGRSLRHRQARAAGGGTRAPPRGAGATVPPARMLPGGRPGWTGDTHGDVIEGAEYKEGKAEDSSEGSSEEDPSEGSSSAPSAD